MKAISLIISIVVFSTSAYFLISDFAFTTEFNHIIYMSLLIVLMLICMIGILINMPTIDRERRRVKTMVYNKIGQQKSKRIYFGLEPS